MGNTYQYTVVGKTATQGYEQLVFFLNIPNTMFRILDVSTSYSIPPAQIIRIMECTPMPAVGMRMWARPDTAAAPGRRTIREARRGGDPISTTYTVRVLSAGTADLSGLIYDFSGSSYHYNSDFGSISTVTAVNPAGADLIIHKTHTENFKQGQTGAACTITVTNGVGAGVRDR